MAHENTGYGGEYSYGGSSGGSYLDDILRDEYDIYLTPEERKEHLWEYDPTEEMAIRGTAGTQFGGIQRAGKRELSKVRGGRGGGFAGGGEGLLDMTVKNIYGATGVEREKTLLGMSTDIYGKRKGYVEDIGAEVTRLAEEKGEEFQEWQGSEQASLGESLSTLQDTIASEKKRLQGHYGSGNLGYGSSGWTLECLGSDGTVSTVCMDRKESEWMESSGYSTQIATLEEQIAAAGEAGV